MINHLPYFFCTIFVIVLIILLFPKKNNRNGEIQKDILNLKKDENIQRILKKINNDEKNDITDITDIVSKCLKKSDENDLSLLTLLTLKIESLSSSSSLRFNEKNKTFELISSDKKLKLSELTNLKNDQPFYLPTTPSFLPFDKSQLSEKKATLIENAREYYNNHPEIAMRLQTYKINDTYDVPLQAYQDGLILKFINV